MSTSTIALPPTPAIPSTKTGLWAWVALFTMTLTSFSLVTAEFLPGGLLTPIAAEFGISAGLAAQMVTVTAVVGFFVAPMIGILTPGVDRRTLLVVLAAAAMVSNIVVAISPNFALLLISRALLGAALSSFWAMSLTVAARITGPERVAQGMMLVNAGTTLATVLGVPLGIIVASALDWRSAFFAIAIVTGVTAVALRIFLPAVPAEAGMTLRTLGSTLTRPGVTKAMIGHVLIVMGHMAAYALIRVAVERLDNIDEGGIASMLIMFGAGGFIGNLVFGMLADRHLSVLRFLVPGLIAVSIAITALATPTPLVLGIAITAWGLGFGGWLVVINTWASHVVPDRLEAAGGLIVAGFQLAISLGAAIGGLIVDLAGVVPALLFAALATAIGVIFFGSAPMKRVTAGDELHATQTD